MINSGSFARVYRGIDPANGKPVAIKGLRNRHEREPAMVEQFRREPGLIHGFDHPNIVRVLDSSFDAAANQHYFVMEFVEGGNLREFMNVRKRLSPADWYPLALQMLEGLDYALLHGVTHRDVKASNVLFSAESGTMKWIDFGMGGTVRRDANGVTYDAIQRTIEYGLLEKSTGAPNGDPKSDIFFLGAVFYLMLAGTPAIPHERNRAARNSKSRITNVVPLSDEPSIPRNVATIVDKMMALDPNQRYSEYASIIRDVRSLGAAIARLNADTESGPPKLLLVHHKPDVQSVIRRKCTKEGYHVSVTNDARRALNVFKLKPSDAIIMDLETTGLEGISAYRQIMATANSMGRRCAAVFLATENQVTWTDGLPEDTVVTFQKPIRLRPIVRMLKQLVPLNDEGDGADEQE
jgi:serine/threonine protein kinase